MSPFEALQDWLARRTMALAARIMRRRRARWADAMRAEFDACDTASRRLRWALGCLFACHIAVTEELSMAYAAALIVAIAAIAHVEWRTDEDTITLAALLLASLALGWFRPRLFWLSGLALGLVVPGVNLVALLTGARPVYETAAQAAAHGIGYVLSLTVLALPALAAALAGRFAARRLRSG